MCATAMKRQMKYYGGKNSVHVSGVHRPFSITITTIAKLSWDMPFYSTPFCVVFVFVHCEDPHRTVVKSLNLMADYVSFSKSSSAPPSNSGHCGSFPASFFRTSLMFGTFLTVSNPAAFA